jgi:prefoldin subunit 5
MSIAGTSLVTVDCPNCSYQNPSANVYCGKCGTRIDGAGAALESQIEAVLSRKFKDRQLVEIELTQAVANRLTDWLKLFGFFAAIPVAVLLGTLAIWGVTKFADVNEKLKTAKASADNLQERASGLSEQYDRLNNAAAKYEALGAKYDSLGAKLDAVAARSEAINKEVESVKTDISRISERIALVPSPALTPDLKKRLEESIAAFDEYLIKVGYVPDKTGRVTVSIVKTMDGNSVSSYSPSDRRMTVTAAYAAEEPANVLYEYMNVVLKTKEGEWGKMASYMSVSIGLEHYFPASFLNRAPETYGHSDWPAEVSNNDQINAAGRGLAHILWLIREHSDRTALDRAILKSWYELQNSASDAHFEKLFAQRVISNLGANGGQAKNLLREHGIQ